MGDFRAVFVKVSGFQEDEELSRHDLSAATLTQAKDEALALAAPNRANFIKIYREGVQVDRIGVKL
jgi:hypothetical protein